LGGIVWLAFELARASALRSQKDRINLQQARSDHERLEHDLRSMLRDLGLSDEASGWPPPEVLAKLQALRGVLAERNRIIAQSRGLIGLLDADRAALHQLVKALGRKSEFDVAFTVARLQDDLEAANVRVQRASTAKQRQFRLNQDRQRLIADRQALMEEIIQVEAALEEIGSGDVHRGVEVLERRRSAHVKAVHEEAMLDKDHRGWRDREHELEQLTKEDLEQFSEEARSSRETELDELLEQLNFESSRAARKKNELNIRLKDETPDEIESRIETIDEDLRLVRQKRDRLMFLANIIRHADQQFRFKHQPDVIQKASEYLAKITGGRYQRMLLEDEERRLMVFEKGSGIPIEVDESLSQGTRDQVYLSIRFALMDHLDANQERLPACLDEVFVNWDADRRQLGYEILKDLASRRQVFIFTCHPWMAEELESVVTAQRIEL
jgi:uncharacterized protein YhaN